MSPFPMIKPWLVITAACSSIVDTSPVALMLAAEQQDPKNLIVATQPAQGTTFWVKMVYTLPGGPDSVINTLQQNGVVIVEHRLRPVTRDSFQMPRPALGQTSSGKACVQSLRRGKPSNNICQPFSYTEADQPPPDPVIDTIITDTVEVPPPSSAVLWEDWFINGVRAPDRNGIGWRGMSAGTGDAILMAPGKMVMRCAGGNSEDDCWTEANISIGARPKLCTAATWRTNAEYAHRNVVPANNKMLRMFGGKQGATRTEAYNGRLSVGMSVNPGTDGGSNLIGEYKLPGGMGPYGLGPNTRVFNRGANQIRLMQCSSVGTSTNTGYSQIWFNGRSIYEHYNLPLFVAGEFNHFQYVYLPGWANSGYAVQTDLELLHVAIDTVPIPAYATP